MPAQSQIATAAQATSNKRPLAQKRKKKLTPVVQNQFFLHHVREMRDQAVAKNWQSKHTYAKMVRALERYPLRLEAPRACLILEGFGQKTCETLQSKLADYAKELGVAEEEALRIGNERFATPKSLKLKVRKQPTKRARLSEFDGTDSSLTVPPDGTEVVTGLADSESSQVADSSVRQDSQLSLSQSQQLQSGGAYRPKPRTGAHAILLTLLQSGGPSYCLSKAELMSLAQPLCDSSFTCPAAGSHYTAWSSMSGLVKRGLVERTRSAGRTLGSYALTEAGIAAAAFLMSAAGAAADDATVAETSEPQETPVLSTAPSSKAAKKPTQPRTVAKKKAVAVTQLAANSNTAGTSKVHAISDSEDEESGPRAKVNEPQANNSVHSISDSDEPDNEANLILEPPQQQQQQLQQPQVSLQFDYCSANNYTIVPNKLLAKKTFDTLLDCDCVLIVCEYEHLVRCNLHYSLDLEAIGRFSDGLVAAFVRERDLPEVSTKAAAKAAAAAAASAATKKNCEATKSKTAAALPLRTASSNPVFSVRSTLLSNQPLITSKTLAWQRHASATAVAPAATAAAAAAPAVAATSTEEQAQSRLMYTIEPDKFEVVFCIDNREHFGMGSVKQMLLPGLLKNNVKCDVRPLQVSDFLWVAKCRETGREAVLNLLVERKRIDDLANSIKDGRFREQKFRLRRSGIAQLLLLVEGFGGRAGAAGHVRMPEETLAQAVCNSQFIDRCTVKYTDSAQHTVAYLTLLTCRLKDMYKGRRLLVHDSMPGSNSDSRPNLSGVLPFRSSGVEANVVDFGEFNRAAIKSKKLVVREMLAKHLLQIGGVTMEKAFAIVQQYPTVQALVEAYSACQSEAERRRLLSGVCHNRLFDKRIGDSISRSVRLSLQMP